MNPELQQRYIHLLNRYAEQQLQFRIVLNCLANNTILRAIRWRANPCYL